MEIEYALGKVELCGPQAETVAATPMFRDWLKRLDPKLRMRRITFQSVDIVGEGPKKRVLFAKFFADCVDEEGTPVPGIVFMRGGAVGILVVLECQGREYVVLTRQPRLPAGEGALLEIPAGMLDGEGHFASVAAKELEEEAGLRIEEESLFDLTRWAWKERWRGVLSSPGGSDEFVRIFLYRRPVEPEALAELEGRKTGVAKEHEKIEIAVLPLDELPFRTPDSKSLAAYCLYRLFQERTAIEVGAKGE